MNSNILLKTYIEIMMSESDNTKQFEKGHIPRTDGCSQNAIFKDPRVNKAVCNLVLCQIQILNDLKR